MNFCIPCCIALVITQVSSPCSRRVFVFVLILPPRQILHYRGSQSMENSSPLPDFRVDLSEPRAGILTFGIFVFRQTTIHLLSQFLKGDWVWRRMTFWLMLNRVREMKGWEPRRSYGRRMALKQTKVKICDSNVFLRQLQGHRKNWQKTVPQTELNYEEVSDQNWRHKAQLDVTSVTTMIGCCHGSQCFPNSGRMGH